MTKKERKRGIRTRISMAFLVVLFISVLPVVEILLDDEKDVCDTFYNEDDIVWQPGDIAYYRPYEDDSTCERPIDVAEDVVYEGIFGFLPRENDNGVLTIPIIGNVISVGAKATGIVTDPLLEYVSSYVPFWDYDVKEIYSYDYYEDDSIFTTENQGQIQVGVKGNYSPYRTSEPFWHIASYRYLVYVEERDSYYVAQKWFNSRYTISTALDDDAVASIYEQLGGDYPE